MGPMQEDKPDETHSSTGTQGIVTCEACLPEETHSSTGPQQAYPDETCLPEKETRSSMGPTQEDEPDETHSSMGKQWADPDGTCLHPEEEARHSMVMQQADLDEPCLTAEGMQSGTRAHTAEIPCSPPPSPILVTAAMPLMRRDSLAQAQEGNHTQQNTPQLGSQSPPFSCTTLLAPLQSTCSDTSSQPQSMSSATSSQTQSQGWVANSSALQASSLLQLAAAGGGFVEKWHRALQRGLKHHRRDCMDMAGKVSICPNDC
jgi:hypothetical protein